MSVRDVEICVVQALYTGRACYHVRDLDTELKVVIVDGEAS